MSYARALGEWVESAWQARGRKVSALPEIAEAAFLALPIASAPEHDPLLDVAAELLDATELPKQAKLDSSFGEPPVTLYHGGDFYIDAYIWRSATTSIHQHAFAGAFAVLAGPSVQARYLFDVQDRVSRSLCIGALECVEMTVLPRGAIHRIEPGPSFVHSVFHLAHPSITLCIRSVDLDDYRPQWDYTPPCLAIDPFATTPLLTRQLQLLDAMFDTHREEALTAASRLVSRVDSTAAFRVCIGVLARGELEHAGAVLDALRAAHGETGIAIERALREESRRLQFRTLRKYTREEGHRFLLACMLAYSNRDAIVGAIERHPIGQGTASRQIARALAEIDQAASTKANPWGIPIGEVESIVVERLLDGLAPQAAERATLDECRARGIATSSNHVRTTCFLLPHVPTLSVLFADAR
jgi:hypothetical protein